MEYDPVMNWNCRKSDPAPEKSKRNLPLRKRRQIKSAVHPSIMATDVRLDEDLRSFPSLRPRLDLKKEKEREIFEIRQAKSSLYKKLNVLNKK